MSNFIIIINAYLPSLIENKKKKNILLKKDNSQIMFKMNINIIHSQHSSER
jgi:hypothetical protein